MELPNSIRLHYVTCVFRHASHFRDACRKVLLLQSHRWANVGSILAMVEKIDFQGQATY